MRKVLYCSNMAAQTLHYWRLISHIAWEGSQRSTIFRMCMDIRDECQMDFIHDPYLYEMKWPIDLYERMSTLKDFYLCVLQYIDSSYTKHHTYNNCLELGDAYSG